MYASAVEGACNGPVTDRIISFVARKTSSVITCSSPPSTGSAVGDRWHKRGRSQHQCPVAPPESRTSPAQEHRGFTPTELSRRQQPPPTRAAAVPPLTVFIAQVVQSSGAQARTLLATLVYIDRLQRRLPRAVKGMHCTRHRVFLAAFILAAKYTNDNSPKNMHWARYAGVFSLAEVNLMEKQLLYLLDFDLSIDESDLLLQMWTSRKDEEVALSPSTPQRMPSSTLAAALQEVPTVASDWPPDVPEANSLESAMRSEGVSDAGGVPVNDNLASAAAPAFFRPLVLAMTAPVFIPCAVAVPADAAVSASYPSARWSALPPDVKDLVDEGFAGLAAKGFIDLAAEGLLDLAAKGDCDDGFVAQPDKDDDSVDACAVRPAEDDWHHLERLQAALRCRTLAPFKHGPICPEYCWHVAVPAALSRELLLPEFAATPTSSFQNPDVLCNGRLAQAAPSAFYPQDSIL